MNPDVTRYLKMKAQGHHLRYDPDIDYFHGGIGGLKPGDYILPPSVTGAKVFSDMCREISGMFPVFSGRTMQWPECRRDRVYVTDRVTVATGFARDWSDLPMMSGLGSVYKVRPIGSITSDPGRHGIDALECERAEILSVVASSVPPSGSWMFRVFAQLYARYLREHGREGEVNWT